MMKKRKRTVLQKLLKMPTKPKPTALDRMKGELAALATKNGFIVRRGEYLLQQTLMLRLQYDEMKSDIERVRNETISLLERAEALLDRPRRRTKR